MPFVPLLSLLLKDNSSLQGQAPEEVLFFRKLALMKRMDNGYMLQILQQL
jgi:hypothetical protein